MSIKLLFFLSLILTFPFITVFGMQPGPERITLQTVTISTGGTYIGQTYDSDVILDSPDPAIFINCVFNYAVNITTGDHEFNGSTFNSEIYINSGDLKFFNSNFIGVYKHKELYQ